MALQESKKTARELEQLVGQLRADNQRWESEFSKQELMMSKIIDGTSGPRFGQTNGNSSDARKELEKSLLVRKLKAYAKTLKLNLSQKEAELEDMKRNSKVSKIIEVTVENEEFMLENKRLKDKVSEIKHDLKNEQLAREYLEQIVARLKQKLQQTIQYHQQQMHSNTLVPYGTRNIEYNGNNGPETNALTPMPPSATHNTANVGFNNTNDMRPSSASSYNRKGGNNSANNKPPFRAGTNSRNISYSSNVQTPVFIEEAKANARQDYEKWKQTSDGVLNNNSSPEQKSLPNTNARSETPKRSNVVNIFSTEIETIADVPDEVNDSRPSSAVSHSKINNSRLNAKNAELSKVSTANYPQRSSNTTPVVDNSTAKLPPKPTVVNDSRPKNVTDNRDKTPVVTKANTSKDQSTPVVTKANASKDQSTPVVNSSRASKDQSTPAVNKDQCTPVVNSSRASKDHTPINSTRVSKDQAPNSARSLNNSSRSKSGNIVTTKSDSSKNQSPIKEEKPIIKNERNSETSSYEPLDSAAEESKKVSIRSVESKQSSKSEQKNEIKKVQSSIKGIANNSIADETGSVDYEADDWEKMLSSPVKGSQSLLEEDEDDVFYKKNFGSSINLITTSSSETKTEIKHEEKKNTSFTNDTTKKGIEEKVIITPNKNNNLSSKEESIASVSSGLDLDSGDAIYENNSNNKSKLVHDNKVTKKSENQRDASEDDKLKALRSSGSDTELSTGKNNNNNKTNNNNNSIIDGDPHTDTTSLKLQQSSKKEQQSESYLSEYLESLNEDDNDDADDFLSKIGKVQSRDNAAPVDEDVEYEEDFD